MSAKKSKAVSAIQFDDLVIASPKRAAHIQSGWDGFFPYYAGFPESFARTLLYSAGLRKQSIVLDPWNGSGTTTYAASHLGFNAYGVDLNPVMSIVARARLLPPSEADSIEPLARELLKGVRSDARLDDDDPLLRWFTPSTAAVIRSAELRFREHLIGSRTLTPDGVRLDNMSGLAATFYVALFVFCRDLTEKFRPSNPTWLRFPKAGERRVGARRDFIIDSLKSILRDMADALSEGAVAAPVDCGSVALSTADTTNPMPNGSNVDFVLTSPPYCTRIDYSAATRIELAVLQPLTNLELDDLGRRMMGSTRVPTVKLKADDIWGKACNSFLRKLKAHPSKASDGYYYKTHLDYFDKMSRSLSNVAAAVRNKGGVVLVVQDSFYKDVHNDLPGMTVEMAANVGLELKRREDFHQKSMADINPNAQAYDRTPGATEAVLCFVKT